VSVSSYASTQSLNAEPVKKSNYLWQQCRGISRERDATQSLAVIMLEQEVELKTNHQLHSL